MSMKDGGAAFPIMIDDPNVPYEAGMTLRDYFAAKAMACYMLGSGSVWRRRCL